MRLLPGDANYVWILAMMCYKQKFEQPEGVAEITSYDTVRHPVTKTPRFCAVNNISMTQTNKKLADCYTKLILFYTKHN